MTERLSVSQTGTLTLTPAAGQAALAAVGLELRTGIGAAPGTPRLVSGASSWIEVNPGGNAETPTSQAIPRRRYARRGDAVRVPNHRERLTSVAQGQRDVPRVLPRRGQQIAHLGRRLAVARAVRRATRCAPAP